MLNQLRIFYAAGPGDVIGTYGFWKAGQDDPREVSATYSGQFYSLCRELDARALLIAQRSGGRRLSDGRFEIAEVATPFQKSKSGALYHLGQLIGAARLTWAAVRFGARVAVVCEGAHWFALAAMPFFGIAVIPDIHCTLWPSGHPPARWFKRRIMALNGWFWRHVPAATLCISPECERQIRRIGGDRVENIIQTRPGFSREVFSRIAPADAGTRPFVLLYAGRVEHDKGVFDLLQVMRNLHAAEPGRFKCVICGSGGADAELAREVARHRLGEVIEMAGQLSRDQLVARIAASHALIVPTTALFVEGLNRVAIEGVLAGRPVILTTVCPAAEIISDAACIVAPGDVDAMTDAARRLASDRPFYEAKRAACRSIGDEFYGPARQWGTGLRRAIEIALGMRRQSGVAEVVRNHA